MLGDRILADGDVVELGHAFLRFRDDLELDAAAGAVVAVAPDPAGGLVTTLPDLARSYATLDRLEDKGLVASWLSDPTSQRGGRAKRHYRLSTDGEAALKEAVIVAGRLRDAVEQRWRGKPWKLA